MPQEKTEGRSGGSGSGLVSCIYLGYLERMSLSHSVLVYGEDLGDGDVVWNFVY